MIRSLLLGGVLLTFLTGCLSFRDPEEVDDGLLAMTGRNHPEIDTYLQTGLETFPSGEGLSWRDKSSGLRGLIVPTRTFKIRTGQYCRDFRLRLERNAESLIKRQTACRSQEGRWIVIRPS